MFEQIPVWMLSGIVALSVAAFVQLGVLLERHIARSQPAQDQSGEGIGSVVGALLGLLAFMLAFAFGMAAERRGERIQLLLDEVNSIGTTYLRTGTIPEPHRSASREILREYVDLRLDAAEHPDRLLAGLQKSTELQRALWVHAEALADADLKNPDIAALYIDSLNETIDLQTSRFTVGSRRIPSVVWVTFALLIVLTSLAVGYNFGKLSSQPRRLMTAMLAVSLAIVMFLIFDLDRGNQGFLKVNQQPLYDLRDQIAAPTTESARPGL
jgi:hypothetical protein